MAKKSQKSELRQNPKDFVNKKSEKDFFVSGKLEKSEISQTEVTPESLHKLQRGWIKEFILGGQDGLVNVLGLILGVASATNDVKIVLIAGIAALFAESISMGAVAYTSSKAAVDFYRSMRLLEEKEIKELPHEERKEIRDIYYNKGFRGNLLNKIVNKITSNKKVWLDTMMREELKIFPDHSHHPLKTGAVVLLATIIGSIIPLFPFFIWDIKIGMVMSFVFSIIALFVIGVVKAKWTIGRWHKSGAEMAVIGILSAVVGYLIGKVLEIIFL